MENLLDHLFSSKWMLMTLFFVLLIVSSIIAYGTNYFRRRIYNWIYKTVVIIIPFVPLFFDSIFPIKYGFSYEIPVMCIIDNKLCLLDKKEKGDDTSDWEEYRLHVLNADNGQKISRKYYSDIDDIAFSKGDSLVLFSQLQFVMVDIKTNTSIRIINGEYLQNRFTELSSGIENWNFSKNPRNDSQVLTLSVTAKTAKTYYYNLFSDSLLPNEFVLHNQPLNYYFTDDKVYWRNIKNESEPVVSLENLKESYKIKQLKFENELVNKSAEFGKNEFLEAEFLEIFPEQKVFVIVSYQTTDKNSFILDAFSFDGKHKWNIQQSELNLTDKYNDKLKLNTSIRYLNNLIFNCGGFIISVNANTGKVNWKQRV